MSVGKASLSRAAAKAKEQAPAEEVKKAPEKKTTAKTTAKAVAKAAPESATKRTRTKKAAEEKAVPVKKTGVSKSTARKGGPVMAVAPEQMQEKLEEKVRKVRAAKEQRGQITPAGYESRIKSNLICDLPTWLL